jgi:hypothetical protein
MPFAPTAPVSENVPATPVAQDVDTFHLIDIRIQNNPNDAAAISAKVRWAEGYVDGETFIKVKERSHSCEGANFITKMNSATEDGQSFYDAVKNGIWDYLEAEGIIAAGSVS